ncbi:hypothetical protein BY458DRAFT_518371 [Sporodiniella umbellata]|nr:hypothetical protein BY458DRAFT_518371 [Sporodiniella umbellata]
MCSLECSKEDANDSKIYQDHSKLVREGRTNTASLLNNIRNPDDIHTWTIQACGLCLYFSTVVYVDNNLFVVIPQFRVEFPTTIGELAVFVKDIEKLFSFKQDIEYLARTSEASLHRSHGLRKGKAIQRMYARELSLSPPRLKVVPDTVNWHTPPRNQVSKSLIPKKNYDIYEDDSDTDVAL